MSATVEGLVIGGDRVAAAEGETFDVTNPATGGRLASVAASAGLSGQRPCTVCL